MTGSPQRRHPLFIGDGAFQISCQELATLMRLGLAPVIFLLNNNGDTIERYILGENSSYNTIPSNVLHRAASCYGRRRGRRRHGGRKWRPA
ncbi:thiamine pyrophosphate-dependent enzyme [Lonsdalea britannica]|uniref:thiamine pyrophosphate-dependent enzyme n=1 Tax=Lonsdalea britannica TaxID=1082704 RepID=UPI0020CAF024|nr:thiamine pyrophosphate-dependent enzyme [Lonsdalea britannica]